MFAVDDALVDSTDDSHDAFDPLHRHVSAADADDAAWRRALAATERRGDESARRRADETAAELEDDEEDRCVPTIKVFYQGALTASANRDLHVDIASRLLDLKRHNAEERRTLRLRSPLRGAAAPTRAEERRTTVPLHDAATSAVAVAAAARGGGDVCATRPPRLGLSVSTSAADGVDAVGDDAAAAAGAAEAERPAAEESAAFDVDVRAFRVGDTARAAPGGVHPSATVTALLTVLAAPVAASVPATGCSGGAGGVGARELRELLVCATSDGRVCFWRHCSDATADRR